MSSQPDPLDQLFAAARARRADTSAMEYGFETRLLARLRSSRSESSVLARMSWRLAPLFAVCVLALGIWQYELTSETNEAQQVAYVDGSVPTDIDLLN